MSVFDCNIMYRKVEGDSYTSTYNKLLSQKMIDKYLNVKTDVATLRKAKSELNSQASAKLGRQVNLFGEKKLLNGIRLVPDMKLFGMIDQVNKRRPVVPEIQIREGNEFIIGGEIFPTLEDAKNNQINEINRRLSDSIKTELLRDATRRSNDRVGNVRGQDNLLPNDNTNSQESLRETDEDQTGRYFLENVEQLMQNVRQRLSDKTSLNGRLFEKLGGSLDNSLVIKEDGHFIYAQGDKLHINKDALFQHLKDEPDNTDEYLETLLFEELIHLLTLQLKSNSDILKLAEEQIKNNPDFVSRVNTVYVTNSASEAYLEYIRILVQDAIVGNTTLGARRSWSQQALDFLKSVLQELKSLVQSSETKKLISDHIDYINQIKEGLPFKSVKEVYEFLDIKNGNIIPADRIEEISSRLNVIVGGKQLSPVKVLDGYLLKVEYKENYLTEIKPQEISVETFTPTDSNSNFNKNCITK